MRTGPVLKRSIFYRGIEGAEIVLFAGRRVFAASTAFSASERTEMVVLINTLPLAHIAV